MLFEERAKLIIEQLEEKNTVSNKELIKLLNVSEATIRRDLDVLEEEGILNRVHGGAVLKKIEVKEDTAEEKFASRIKEKKQIAKIASILVEEKDFIFLDAGTTTFELIPYLQDKNITVVTNGLMHLEELMKYNINSYLIGGYIKKSTKALVGSIALNNLKAVNFSKAFIGINGIDSKYGFTTPDVEEANIKIKAIENSLKAYILADESKFGKVYFSKIAELDQGTIITNDRSKVSDEIKKKAKILGV